VMIKMHRPDGSGRAVSMKVVVIVVVVEVVVEEVVVLVETLMAA
jgi:hypothetical protein